jgi:PIN domain nuclease of toxin-antitoxin system
MNLLLDTCVFIWLATSPNKLSAAAKRAINDSRNELWLSHASVWEIHLNHLAGKLTLPEKPRLWFPRQMAVWAVRDRALDLESVHLTYDLPPVHKDPFDRLLVAQATTHDMTLVSPDEFFPKYDVKALW